LKGKVSLILDGGPCAVGLESTVVDGLHEDGHIRVLRPGGITVEDIERVLQLDIDDVANIPKVLVHKRDYADDKIQAAPTTPGMKYRHYSPSVPVSLLLTRPSLSGVEPATSFSDYVHSLQKSSGCGKLMIGVLAATDSKVWEAMNGTKDISWLRYPLGPLAEPSVIAHNLFDGLLSLEKGGVELIFIEEIDEAREGLAVMNRVRKAASESIHIELDKYGLVYSAVKCPHVPPPGWRANWNLISNYNVGLNRPLFCRY
jgi:L-threonylcarbamoyladenylate synthase